MCQDKGNPIGAYSVDYYIVRIYRRDETEERNLTGLVEIVGHDGVNVFKSREDLWNILSKQSAPDALSRKDLKKSKEG